MSRAEAKAAGLKRYFTGKPCTNGHVAERNRHGHCLECTRIKAAKLYAESPEYRERIKTNNASPEARARMVEWSAARWANDLEYRTKQAEHKATEKYRAENKAYNARYYAIPEVKQKILDHAKTVTARNQAHRAAQILTETLGIPHKVVKMEDGTFQPVPE